MRKAIVVVVVVAGLIAFVAFDAGRFFTLEHLRSSQSAIQTHYAEHPVRAALVYFANEGRGSIFSI